MSYSKREDVAGQAGEQVVELDDGSLVAVQCARIVEGGLIRYSGRARAISETGETLVGLDGRQVERELAHSDRNAPRADAVARDCLLALLGEQPEVVAWGGQYLLDVSIRQAIALAAIPPGAVDAGGAL
ncbi:hypothetical protein BV378_14260 [Nostoc sp. RF31YmG]|jgi:hypothetical protein|nr:hypothetical protein BV378_14260 [Nostoc sp. RF31YmG]